MSDTVKPEDTVHVIPDDEIWLGSPTIAICGARLDEDATHYGLTIGEVRTHGFTHADYATIGCPECWEDMDQLQPLAELGVRWGVVLAYAVIVVTGLALFAVGVWAIREAL